MEKRILILTAGFGEGHNAAARGLRDGLSAVSRGLARVELHDLFEETYGPINKWARHITAEQVQAESIGDQPARVGRIVRIESGVWCS